MSALEVSDPVDRSIKASEEAMAACDRMNDHSDEDAGVALDLMRQARQDHLHHRPHHHGWRPSGVEVSNIDAPWVWPKTATGREGRLHLCEACNEAKPYSEFERNPYSQIYTGRVCNKCVEDKRRLKYVPRDSRLGT